MEVNLNSRFKHHVVENYKDGECIFAEGDDGRNLYIVQSGQVRIVKKMGDKEVELAVFDRGDFFGDMGLLQNIPRYAGAFARGEVRVLVLGRAGFLLKMRRDPTFAFEMLQQLSHRIKVSNDRLLLLVQKSNLPTQEIQKILHDLDGKA
jgi:CRP-like cAMP-binding protein